MNPTKNQEQSPSNSLASKIAHHHKNLSRLAPALQGVDMTSTAPEKDKIYLPSSFSPAQVKSFQLEEMACVEQTLRRSHCHDLLDSLRQALGCKSFLARRLRGPKAEHGYKHSTRAQTEVDRAEALCTMWANAYTASFKLYIALGPDPTDLIGLQELQTSDLTMLSSWLETNKYHSTDSKLSWLWKMTPIDISGETSPNHPRFTDKVHAWNEEGMYSMILIDLD